MSTVYIIPSADESGTWLKYGDSTIYGCVDDSVASPDDGTTYIHVDRMGTELSWCVKIGSSGTTDSGTVAVLPTSWGNVDSGQLTTDPDGNAWTKSNLQNLFFGVYYVANLIPPAPSYLYFSHSNTLADIGATDTINWIKVHYRGYGSGTTARGYRYVTQVYIEVDYSAGVTTYRTDFTNVSAFEAETTSKIRQEFVFNVEGKTNLANNLPLTQTGSGAISHLGVQTVVLERGFWPYDERFWKPTGHGGANIGSGWEDENETSDANMYTSVAGMSPILDTTYICNSDFAIGDQIAFGSTEYSASWNTPIPSWMYIEIGFRVWSSSGFTTEVELTPWLYNASEYAYALGTPFSPADYSRKYDRTAVWWDIPTAWDAWPKPGYLLWGLRVTDWDDSAGTIYLSHTYLRLGGYLEGAAQDWEESYASSKTTGYDDGWDCYWDSTDGNNPQYQPLHWALLGYQKPAGDTTYVYEDYQFGGTKRIQTHFRFDTDLLPENISTYGFRFQVRAKTDTGTIVVQPQVVHDGSTWTGSNITVTSSWQTFDVYCPSSPGSSWDTTGDSLLIYAGFGYVSGTVTNKMSVSFIRGKFHRTDTDTHLANFVYLEAPPQCFHGVANTLQFEAYDPDWWNASYCRRAPLNFDSSHAELASGSTVEFDMFTGYMEILSTEGAKDESVQHSTRAMQYYEDDDCAYTFAVWMERGTNLKIYGGKYTHRDTNHPENEGTWSTAYLWDSGSSYDIHYYPWILLDHSGYIWIFYGCHTSNMSIKKSTSPLDMSTWTTLPTINNGCSYPRAIETNDNEIVVFYRSNISDVGNWGFSKWDSDTSTWSAFQHVARYSNPVISGNRSIYCGGICYDSNTGRFHVILDYWDSYGSENKSRGLAYLYSDDLIDWYDMTGKVGTTDTDKVDYPDVTMVAESPNHPTAGPWYFTNAEALCVDSNGYPHFTFESWYDAIREECDLFHCCWNGTSWVTTNLANIATGKQIYYFRAGTPIYYDNGVIYIYALCRPADSTETYFGGEMVRFTGYATGTQWQMSYITKNSGFGVGSISVLPERPTNSYRQLLFSRGREVCFFMDTSYPYIRSDGEDVRIVRQDCSGATQTDTELDRLPKNSWGSDPTTLLFKLDQTIPAGNEGPHTYGKYWVYWGNYQATNAPNDPQEVYTWFEGWEQYDNRDVPAGHATLGDWVAGSGTASDIWVCAYWDDIYYNAHPNKLYSGAKSLYVDNTSGSVEIYRPVNLTNHVIEWWFWCESYSGNWAYIKLYNSTSGDWFGCGGDDYAKTMEVGDSAPTTHTYYDDARYLNCKIIFDGSTYKYYVDGNLEYSGTAPISSADRLYIGTDGPFVFFDHIAIYPNIGDYTATLGDVEGEDLTPSPSKFGSTLVPAHYRASKVASSMSMQRSAVARIYSNAVVAKMTTTKLAGIMQGAKTTALKIAQSVTGDKVTVAKLHDFTATDKVSIAKLADDLTLQMSGNTHIAGLVASDKVLTTRIAQSIANDKATVDKLAMAIAGNKETLTKLDHTTVTDKTELVKLAGLVIGDKELSTEQAHTLIPDKSIVARLTEYLGLENSARIRVLHTLLGDKELATKVRQIVVGDKELLTRIRQQAELDAIDSIRIANTAQPDKATLAKVAQDITLEDELYTRLTARLVLDSIQHVRLSQLLTLDDVAITSWAQAMVTDKEVFTRILHHLSPDAETTVRILHAVETDKVLATKAANTLGLDKEETANAANLLGLDKETLTIIVHLVLADKTDLARIAQQINVHFNKLVSIAHTFAAEKAASFHMANRAPVSPEAAEKLANLLAVDKTTVARSIQSLNPDKEVVYRLSQFLASNKIVTARITQDFNAYKHSTLTLAQDILTDREKVQKLVGILTPEKELIARITNLLPLQGWALDRLNMWCSLDKTSLGRLAEIMNLRKVDLTKFLQTLQFEPSPLARLADALHLDATRLTKFIHGVPVDKAAQIAIAHSVATDKEAVYRTGNVLALEGGGLIRTNHLANLQITTFIRLSNFLSLENTYMERLAQFMPTDVERLKRVKNATVFTATVVARLREHIGLDKISTLRFGQASPLEAFDLTRLPQMAALLITSLAKMGHGTNVEKTTSSRLGQVLQSCKTSLLRLFCLLTFIPPKTGVRFTNEDMQTLKMVDCTIGAISIGKEDMAQVLLSSETMTAIGLTDETVTTYGITRELITP